MINLVKADLYKMSKMSSIYISFLICLCSALGIAYVLYGIPKGDFDIEMSTNVSLLVDIMLVSLFGGILAGGIISSDFESKNIHSEIACGKGRFSIVLSKLISFAIGMFFITLPYAIVAIVGFAMDIEFSNLIGIPSQFFDVMTNVCGIEKNGAGIGKAVFICILIIYMYIARLSICIPIAFKMRKNIPVIIVGFISAFIFDIISSLVTDIPGISDFFAALPYSMITKCTLDAEMGEIIKILLSGTIFIAVMVAITYIFFKKDEIK